MGEYIDVGLQSSILPFTLILSSVLVGIYALLGFETEKWWWWFWFWKWWFNEPNL